MSEAIVPTPLTTRADRFPSAFTILFALVIVVAAASWSVPDGEYTRVARELLGRDVRFLHCLPAFHDDRSEVGAKLCRNTGLDWIEVSDDVVESAHSTVFDQAENRMHSIKAVLIATLGT